MKLILKIQSKFKTLPKSIKVLGLLCIFGILVSLFLYYYQTPKYIWKENDRKMYKIEINSFQNSSSEQLALMSSSFETNIKAVLNMRVLELNSKGVKVLFQFYPFEMRVAEQRQTLIEELCMKPFLGEFSLDGKVKRWIFPNAIAEKDEKAILQNFLFFHPILGDNKKKWVLKETDSLGEYIAKYNYKSGKVLKSKVKYTKVSVEESDDGESENFTSNIQISYGEFLLDEKTTWLKNAHIKEKFELNGNLFELDVRQEGLLENITYNPDPVVSIWKDPLNFEEVYNTFTAGDKKQISLWDEANRLRLEKEYKGKNLSILLAQFLKDPSKPTELHNLEKIREYLNAFPEESLKIPELIKRGKINGYQIMEVLYILSKLGHQEAQNTLLSIAKDSEQGYHARMQAIGSFHEVKLPLEGTAPTLWEIYNSRKSDQEKEYSNTALLALGSISNRTKHILEAGEPQSERIKKELLKELEKHSKDNDRTNILLSAIGNTADSSLLPKIQDKMESNDKMVRAAFYDAIANFKSKEAMDILKDKIDKEQSPEARNKIIQGLMQNPSDSETTKRVHESLLKESDANNRNYLIKYLIHNRQYNPELQNQLKDILKTEENPTNRELLFRGIYAP